MLRLDVKRIAIQYCTDAVDVTSTDFDKYYIQSSLLEWYRANRRKLPWRGDETDIPQSAYGTWVSEVMLQQTRVETVIEYWNRWMSTFPDVQTLSVATPDNVNKLWAGLGYYRRAQMLLKGAIKVVEDYDGVLPDTTQDLLKIPGIGPYTAGAIASIAYDKSEPLVDGNVMRVFSRLLAMKLEVGGGAMEKQCWRVASELVPSASPGDFNQALMELGATVCKPTSPACANCPLRSVCHAKLLVDHAALHDTAHSVTPTARSTVGLLELFAKKRKSDELVAVEDIEESVARPANTPLSILEVGFDMSLLPRDVAEFPRKVAKKKAKELAFSVCVLRTTSVIDSDFDPSASSVDWTPESRYLFVRRPATGLLANQWEFPSVNISSADGMEDPEDQNSTCDKINANELWVPFPAYFVERLHMQWRNSDTNTSASKDCVKAESPEGTVLLETHANNEFEPIVHIFSHQRHTMHLSLRDVQVVSPPAHADRHSPAPAAHKWMTAAEIVEAGITTGCKKILAQVTKTAATATKTKSVKKTVFPTPKHREMRVESEITELIDEEDADEKGPVNAFELMRKSSSAKATTQKKAKK